MGDLIDDRFEIEGMVAEGGMGRVYRAHDRQLGVPVAVKTAVQQDAVSRERFQKEAAVLSDIHHPGIVRYVAHGIAQGVPYLVMEWLEGQDLEQYLRRHWDDESTAHTPSMQTMQLTQGNKLPAEELTPTTLNLPDGDRKPTSDGNIPPATALQLGRRLASAVAELHKRGFVHQDIKPGNLFLRDGSIEHVKLIDFGTVRHSPRGDRALVPRRLVGTAHYMAPEQARTGESVGPAADVWAIGCVLYRCLTGMRPFDGEDLVVILTRILLDQPISVRTLCPELPESFADLIMRTLSKAAADRPTDALALQRELDAIDLDDVLDDPAQATLLFAGPQQPILSRRAITEVERRVSCMLFAGGMGEYAGAEVLSMRKAVFSAGGELHRLANGTLMVTVTGSETPLDQATRVARAALALHDVAPDLAVVMATGTAEGPHLFPEVESVAQAVRTLHRIESGRLQLDEPTANLLAPRFRVQYDSVGAYLLGERHGEVPRPLLGKPTPWVGRHKEMVTLMATFEECVTDDVARVVLITGAAGVGKSRLRYEFERALSNRDFEFEAIRGYGDVLSSGSPFVLIAPAIRKTADIRSGEPLAERQRKLAQRLAETVPISDRARVTAFIGELVGVPFPDADDEVLRAARRDPLLRGQRMQAAWEDWLKAECQRRPVILFLEDVHWGDLPSIKYIDSALRVLSECPFLVVAMARSEVDNLFPKLWETREPRSLKLHPLSPKASKSMITGVLGAQVADETSARIVELAGGNPFFLEELIRTVAKSGSDSLPDSILGMTQSGLDTLGNEAKRVLRAASIFGEVFWHGGVEHLLGSSGLYDVGEWLDELVVREVISQNETSRFPGEAEYRFQHALMREGAYAMLTDDDRMLGHALAGAWLERAGEQDALVLAEHFIRGDERMRAVPCFVRAARQALEGNDFDGTIECAERGVLAGARSTILGRLRALQAVACYWRDDYGGAWRYGAEAAELLPAGSGQWFAAIGSAIAASARVGDYAQVDALFAAAEAAPSTPGASTERIVCLARGTTQLIFQGRLNRTDRMLAVLAEAAAASHPLSAEAAAQIQRARSMRAASAGQVGACLRHIEQALVLFQEAGDTRNLLLERSTAAWARARLGDDGLARTRALENLRACEDAGARRAITYAKVNVGSILIHDPDRFGDALGLLQTGIIDCQAVGNRRLEGWARAHLATLHRHLGDYEAEESEAAHAIELFAGMPGLRAWALAVWARALTSLGRAKEALAPAKEALALAMDLGGLPEGMGLPRLAWAEALWACENRPEARRVIAEAAAELRARAAEIGGSEEMRRAFLHMGEHGETMAYLRAWNAG